MADITLHKAFNFPIAWLQRYAPRFQTALDDPGAGSEILAHLSPTFRQELAAKLALLSQLGIEQSHARGTMGELTRARRRHVRRISLLCGSARQAAKRSYATNDAVKHGEFMVGQSARRDLASVLRRADMVLAACQQREAALSAHGWSPALTAQLADAIAAAKSADVAQESAADYKESCTAEQIHAANDVYWMLRALQNVARVVYAPDQAEVDPAVVGHRARFLLGEFPPRDSSNPPRDPSSAQAAREPLISSAAAPEPSSSASVSPGAPDETASLSSSSGADSSTPVLADAKSSAQPMNSTAEGFS